jgi:divalent metal cation (Fe/Co/Zn/Cd) transporter
MGQISELHCADAIRAAGYVKNSDSGTLSGVLVGLVATVSFADLASAAAFAKEPR